MQKENFFIRYAHIITVVSLSGIVFCIVLIFIFSLRKQFDKTTRLSLQFAPSNAILTLDNGTVLRTGTYEIQSGTYTGALTADGFQSKVLTFEIASRQTTSLTDYLIHSSDGLKHYEKSASNISTLRIIKDDPEVQSFLEAYDYKLSIYDKLPLSHNWYNELGVRAISTLTITDGNNHSKCNGTLCLIITSPVENKLEFTKVFTDNGYNIKDYEVIYEKSY